MNTPTARPENEAVAEMQADRDAALALLDRLHLRERATGSFRSWDETVQAFVRHRLASTPTALPGAEDVALREAIEAICEMQERHYGDGIRTHMALIGLCKKARIALEEIERHPHAGIANNGYASCREIARGALARDAASEAVEGVAAVNYSERVEYEDRILAAEMQSERLKRALKPFADKADKWEANHAHAGRDSTQVQHRLGDFRAARTAIKEATDEG